MTEIPATIQGASAPFPEVMTDHQAADYLGLSVATLRAWRLARKGPPYVQLGRAIRYRRSDLDAYLAARTVTHRLGFLSWVA
jgi:excisionase family DNA binding protein